MWENSIIRIVSFECVTCLKLQSLPACFRLFLFLAPALERSILYLVVETRLLSYYAPSKQAKNLVQQKMDASVDNSYYHGGRCCVWLSIPKPTTASARNRRWILLGTRASTGKHQIGLPIERNFIQRCVYHARVRVVKHVMNRRKFVGNTTFQ